jgi:hypothetical protein
MLSATLLKSDPIEVAVGVEPDEEVVVGIRLWPSVEVFSYGRMLIAERRREEDNIR